MTEKISIPAGSPLFAGLSQEEVGSILQCLGARETACARGERIAPAAAAGGIGVVLEGRVHMVKEDFWGNQSLIGEAGQGQVFGETLACCPRATADIHVLAVENSRILLLNLQRVLTVCPSSCGFHSRLVQNLVLVLAERNLLLMRKVEHMAQRSLRRKLLSYLSWQSQLAGAPEFRSPFNRQQLADYLAVDRSALSAELSRMQREGLLAFRRQWFHLERLPETEREHGFSTE